MAETTKKPNHESHDDANAQISFERRDVNVFQITAFGIGLLIGTLVVVFAMWALFAYLVHREDARNGPVVASMVAEKQHIPPEPRLSGVKVENGQVDPHPVYPKVELGELLADEDAILNNYGWIDPANNKVRIPIAQAIDIVSQSGKLPQKPTPAGLENSGYRTIPSVASSGRTLEKISQ
jgi:hypothetical protein